MGARLGLVGVCWLMTTALMGEQVPLPSLEDVPDPFGLGPRLALIDYLREEVGLEPPAGADLAALVALYEGERAKRLPAVQKAAQATQRRAELSRQLWVEFGVTADDGADEAALAAQLQQLRTGVEQELARQRQDSAEADRRLPLVVNQPSSKGSREEVVTASQWKPAQLSDAGFHRVASSPISLSSVIALRSRPNQRDLTPQQVAERYRHAVTLVFTNEGTGTGFFINKRGLMLTCAHVLPALEGGSVGIKHHSLVNGSLEEVISRARLVAIDQLSDLALIQVETDAETTPVVFGESRKIEMGVAVSVIGNPGNGVGVLEQTMTQGIISNPERVIEDVPHIQTNAAVNPGNSGGPLFDGRGNVIGLVVSKLNDIEGVGFAVSRDAVVLFLERCAK